MNNYYHYSSGPGLRYTAVKRLILANIIVFLFQAISHYRFNHLFGLVPAFFIDRLWLWQVVTYMFLHGGIFHLAFNMLALWMFGQPIEAEWGRGEFIKYYFLTGIGAGVLTYFSSPHSIIPTVGASGAIFGLLAAYGLMFPDNMVLVFFVFPMKAKYFVLLFAGLEFWACLEYTPDGIGHFAHLGGMVIGYLYLKVRSIFRMRWSPFRGVGYILKNWQAERQKREGRIFSDRVDRVLDKINRQGLDSLSWQDRRILKRYQQILR